MKFETRREQAQRLKKQKRSGVFGIIAAFVLVIILGIAVWSSKISLEKKNAEYQAAKIELETKLEEQESRAENLEEYKKYIQTKKFVEEMARDKFGLIYPDEQIFKPQ